MAKFISNRSLILITTLTLMLGGCASHNPANIQPPEIITDRGPIPPTRPMTDGAPSTDIDVSNIPDATPKSEQLSKYGNPAVYSANGHTYHVLKTSKDYDKTGIASWYGTKFHGQLTSTREPYDLAGMTAASTDLPLPTYVRVTNLENSKQVVVKVNDRGPFDKDRVIDLSYAAAKKLGYANKGTALVRVTALDPGADKSVMYAENTVPIKNKPQIYLQVGSFAHSDNAYQLRGQIATLTDKPVRVAQNNVANKTVYRVQIGPLASVDENDDLEQKLKTKNLGKPITVVE